MTEKEQLNENYQEIEPEELTDEELAEYNAAMEDALGLPSPSEPVLLGTLALGAACSLLSAALIAPQRATTPIKTVVALVGPLALSAGVGAYLRSVVIPSEQFEEEPGA